MGLKVVRDQHMWHDGIFTEDHGFDRTVAGFRYCVTMHTNAEPYLYPSLPSTYRITGVSASMKPEVHIIATHRIIPRIGTGPVPIVVR